MVTETDFDWSELAFASKKPLNDLRPIFVAAPRELSSTRLAQIIKEYLPAGNILVGIAKEQFVEGLEDEPQFRMLALPHARDPIDRVNAAKLPHRICTLSYFQRELPYILQKLQLKKVVLVRGSWHHAFHTRPEYYTLVERSIPYSMISPFVDEAEAHAYEKRIKIEFETFLPDQDELLGEYRMLDLAKKVASASYDYTFQTGAVLGRRIGARSQNYHFLTFGFNKVVPFQTYALHYGASREENFSPPNDLNYYDTIHAEVKLLINAQRFAVDLRATTLFINLMPCPTCTRMIAETDIAEVVYSIDHSDGYAVQMLEKAGKKVRRVVPQPQPEL